MEDLLNIKNGDVISIVGSGGKTTVMYYLANILSKKKVLVTTTTKIRIPEKNQYDYLGIGIEAATELSKSKDKGVYVLGDFFNAEKLESLPLDFLESIVKDFNFSLIEADGAKEKLIKAWNDNEPVVLNNTTKTIAVVNLDVLGKRANEDNVHRIDKFLKLTNLKINEIISEEVIIKLITDKEGIFKNSKGEKIVFINAAEGKVKKIKANYIADKLKYNNYKVIIGSLKEGEFYCYDKC